MGNPNVKVKPSTGTVIDHSSTTTTPQAQLGTQIIMPANESRTYLVVQNIDDTTMHISFASPALVSNSIRLEAGGSVTFNNSWVPSQAVILRCTSSGKFFVAKEGI